MLSPVVFAAVLESTSAPYPGVTHEVWVEASIPARIQLVEVDLTSQEIHLVATTEGERGATPCEYSTTSGAQIVVNGDYFSPVGFEPAGLAMGETDVWAGTADDALEGFFRFDRNMDENRATISAPEDVVAAMDLPVGTIGVVGGRPLVVRAGIQQTAFDCTDLIAMPCARAPRTAVALSVDRQTLWLAVVDGWQAASLGMTAAELGSFLEQRGAHDALLLDGGASSALCVDGAVASEPSDGVERSVANHLGVLHGTLPPGELFGVTFECELITGPIVSGVRVELDDGQSVVTGADGRYTFTNLTPRYACVTASKLGYVTKTQCKQVAPGVITYNSIDLAPESGCPMVDAGPTPDAGPDPDAAPADAAATDGGPGGDGGGDGCGCRAAGDASFAWLVAWALAVLLTSGTKRRSR